MRTETPAWRQNTGENYAKEMLPAAVNNMFTDPNISFYSAIFCYVEIYIFDEAKHEY